jgi:hypothetical protein
VIEFQVCKIHNEMPLLELINNVIIINTCCSDFKVTCLKLLVRILVEHKDQKMELVWKKPDEGGN